MTIAIIAGARPNFMKVGPIIRQLKNAQLAGVDISYKLIHTGQHYDARLSDNFFEDLHIPMPDVNFSVGSGSHAKQTAEIMIKFEEYLQQNLVDMVLVVGDVNSTLACTLVAKKLNLPVTHVEAGLRSNDRTMPEEINRLATDAISDLLLTTTVEAAENLYKEGHRKDKVIVVGNTMIDSLKMALPTLRKPELFERHELRQNEYFVLTLHRPSNVDDRNNLKQLIDFISTQAAGKKVIFPVHPRTKANLALDDIPKNILIVEPVRYLEFIYLLKHAKGVLTDSGGVQEETSYMNIPCITLRENTERPETVAEGTNLLVGLDLEKIASAIQTILRGKWKDGTVPALWDGQAAGRIVDTLLQWLIAKPKSR